MAVLEHKIIWERDCLRCKHKWFPGKPGRPTICPKCKSPKWNGGRADRPPQSNTEPVAGEERFAATSAAFYRSAKPEIRHFIEEAMERYSSPGTTHPALVTKKTKRPKKT